MSAGKPIKTTATVTVSAVDAEWAGFTPGTVFLWLVQIMTGHKLDFEVFSTQNSSAFLANIDDVLAAAGYRSEGQWIAGSGGAYDTQLVPAPANCPPWASERGQLTTHFLDTTADNAGVALRHSHTIFDGHIPSNGVEPMPLAITLQRRDRYANGKVVSGVPWVAVENGENFDILPEQAHEIARLLENAAAVLEDDAESEPPHQVVTVERQGGFAARCECSCGAITAGGFPTRTAAREALARQFPSAC